MELNYRYKQLLGVHFNTTGIRMLSLMQPQQQIIFLLPDLKHTTAIYNAYYDEPQFPCYKMVEVQYQYRRCSLCNKRNCLYQSLNQSVYAYRVNVLNQFTFPKDWSAEISAGTPQHPPVAAHLSTALLC